MILISLFGCGAAAPAAPAAATDQEEFTVEEVPDGAAPLAATDLGDATPIIGDTMRVIAASLNLRDGPDTSHAVIAVLRCGDAVEVLGGPKDGWWNVRFGNWVGWASGRYLVAEAGFDPALCGSVDGGVAPNAQEILDRCKTAVGYSYFWGHGSWRLDGQQIGACVGDCPTCTHSGGSYGADCSGLVAKCWQVPTPSAVTTDLHPYSTNEFYNDTTHWAPVPRSELKPADGLVYRASGAGHIALFESGSDPWGALWVYECQGCATGCVHDLRPFSSAYISIRREGL